MKAATKPLSRLVRDLFRVEPLEPRVLLSADPITGAAQIVLRPADDDGSAALVAQAYAAQADVAVATTPGATVVVSNGAAQAGQSSEWLHVDTQQLGAGNGTLLVGGADADAIILVGEQGGPALHMGTLVLVNPQEGGEVFLRSELHLTGSLVIMGSGHTTQVIADTDTDDNIFILDSVEIVGDRSLTAGNDGTGDLQLGEDSTDSLNGDGVGGTDSLVLRAPGNVSITGPVGNSDPLEGLLIGGVEVTPGSEDVPEHVSFTRAVTVNGDLEITASGTVTFNDRVEITGGGSLRIFGADQVIFRSGVVLSGVDGNGDAGDLFLEANEITFQGGDESVSGQGVLTLRPTLVTAGIELGTPPTSQPTGVLNISNDEIRSFAEGFSRIVVGHQAGAHAAATAGAVRIGAINALDQPTLRDPLEVYGGTITVEDFSTSDYVFQVEGAILLDARNDIVLRNRVEASLAGVLTGISLYSESGRVLQENAPLDQALAEPLRADTLTVRAATGISLGYTEVTTLNATNVTSGDVVITETAAGGDVAVELLDQAGSGVLTLNTTAGNITVGGSGVSHAGTGATLLQAAGTAAAIVVNESVHSTGGSIQLTAQGAITITDDATNDGTVVTDAASAVGLTSNAGSILQGGRIQSGGGAVSLDAFTTLVMNDGVVTRSVSGADSGSVSLRARGGDVTVSVVEADGTISITSAGAIIDGLTGTAANLDGDTAAAVLTAVGGIGAAGASLHTRVNALSAVATAGGIYVREETALRLDGGTTVFAVDAGTGPVAIVTADGALTVDKQVRASGHLLLQSGEADESSAVGLVLQASVTAGGSMSLLSADAIVIDNGLAAGPAVTAGAGQTLDVQAYGGIAMDAGATLAVLGGSARLWSSGDVVLGSVDVGAGALMVWTDGSILDAQADDAAARVTNLTAGELRLEAGASIGAAGAALETAAGKLAAQAWGDVFLHEADALEVGELAATVGRRIGSDGALGLIIDPPAPVGITAAAGALSLHAVGALSVVEAIAAGGNLHLGSDASLGLDASIGSSGGSLSLVAANTISATADAEVYSDAGTIEAQANTVTLADGSVLRTDARNIRIEATTGTLTVGSVDARSVADRAGGSFADAWGDVSLVAGAGIVDNADEASADVHARYLRLLAGSGIGAAAQDLEVEVTELLAANSGTGGLFVSDETSLAIGTVADFDVDAVDREGVAVAAAVGAGASGVASGGVLVLRALDGALVLDAGGVAAAGNLLLQAEGLAGSVSVGTGVAGGGHISIVADGDLLVMADIEAEATGKTIDLYAGGSILQAEETAIRSADGNIALDAGDVAVLVSIDAGDAGVWVAGTAIIDGDGVNDAAADIVAGSAQLLALDGIGAAGAELETSVGTLSAQVAAGSLFITESDGVSVGTLELNVQMVDAEGNVTATDNGAQEGLLGETVVLTVTAGDLAVTAGADSGLGALAFDGNLRLAAVAGTVSLAGFVGADGDLTVLASGDIVVGAESAVGSAAGSVELDAGGSIAMAADSTIATDGVDIALRAGGDITVGVVDARTFDDRDADPQTLVDQANWGYVSLLAGGAIADNADETDTDIFAAGVRLQAGLGIGAATQHLELETARLAALADAGSVYLTEATDVEVMGVDVADVYRVGLDGTSAAGAADTGLSGLQSDGALVLQTVAGSIVLAGANAGQVTAAGNLRLSAQGAASDLDARSAISSTGGHVSAYAGRDMLLAADVAASGAARTIDLLAGGAIVQSQATLVSTHSGNVSLAATGNATLEAVTAGSTGTAIRVSAAAIVDGDAAGDTEADLVAGTVQLLATGAIGAIGAQLETTTTTLAVDADGDVFLNNTGALVFGNTTVNVSRVDAAGASAATTHALLAGLSGDDVVVRALTGNLTVNSGAAVNVTGNLLLQSVANASNLTLNAAATAVGAISLAAGNDVLLNAALTTTGTGNASTIDVVATSGRIVGAQGSSIVAANASVQLNASASVTLELVQAGTGNVRIVAGEVFDGDTALDETEVDVLAAGLQITSGSSVASGSNALETSVDRLSVAAGSSSITIVESTGLVLGTVGTSVNRVGLDGVAVATGTVNQSNVAGSTIVVRTLAGSLASEAGGAVVASGNLLLRAAGTDSDLTLGAAVSSGGNVSIEAGRDLLQGANVTASTATRTMDLRAVRHLAQAQGVVTSTVNGNASLTAGGTLTLESISAGAGRVALFGAGIVDGDADGDSEVDVLANGVRFQAASGAIGTSLNALETTTSSLAVTASGDVFVTESDGVTLETVVVSVTRVLNGGGNGTPESVAAVGLGGDDIVVRTLAGSLLTQASGNLTATGNVLLQAGGATSDLALNMGVISSGGHISLAAGQDLLLNANVAATAATKTVDLLAGRNLTQAQATNITSAGGNVALQAAGIASLELVNAGAGSVRIAATTVVDSDGGLNEAELDVQAESLVLQVSGATGTGSNALETTIVALAAAGGGNLFLAESTALATRSLTVNVQRVAANATSAATANGAVAGLATGTTAVRTAAGALTIEAGAAVLATGNLLLQAGGTGTLTVQDTVSGAGHVTLNAGGSLQQSANVSATTAARTLHLQAAGAITQQQGVTASSAAGPLSLQAGGDVTLARLEAGTGTVRIVGANVLDVDADDDTVVDVVAAALQLQASAAVGTAANALETTVTTLAADAGGDLFVDDSDALVIGATSVTVQRVGQDGIAVADAVANLNGLAGDGAAVVRATGGALTTSTTTGGVTVAGNLLLQAAGADLRVGAGLASSGGHVTLDAGQDLLLDANVQAQGPGKTVDLLAARSIVQAQGTGVTTNGGNIALATTTGTSTIELLAAGAGGVLVTGGALIDGDAAGDSETDITAAVLQIRSGGAVGAAGAAVETSVGTLVADAAGNLFLTEATALVIDEAELTVRRVAADGSDAETAGVLTSGLVGGGHVVLQTVAGDLSNTADGSIEAAGNLLLRAGGTDSDLTLDGEVLGEGAITLQATRDLLQNAQVDAVTADMGLELLAGRDFVQAQDVSASSAGGVLNVAAGGDATLESLDAGTGVVRLQAVDVIDGDTAGDAESDVTAAGLVLVVTGTVGTGANALETTVDRVAGDGAVGVFLTETDALVLGRVDFEGRRVAADGTAGSTGAFAYWSLGGGDVVMRTAAGDLSSQFMSNMWVTGNLRLASASGFDIRLAGEIGNDAGAITIDSGGELALDASIVAYGTGATIELVAALGIVQAQGTTVASTDGAIVLQATTDITLESLDAGTAAVHIQGRSVLDGDAAGDGEVDIAAGGLLVAATGSVAASGAALETSVARVTAIAAGDIFLTESDDVEVGLVEATVQTVGEDGTTTAVVLDDQSLLQGATIVLRTLDGALDVLAAGAVSAQGNLLLAAGGTDGHVSLSADVTATEALSIDAAGDLVLEGDLSVTDDGATIDILAGGAIDAREGSSITSVDGDIQLDAGGTFTLESVDAGAGSVRIAAAAVVDGDEDEAADSGEVDVTAASLQVSTSGDVAALADALETTVGTLSVDAGGSITIAESDDLLLDTVSTTVDRVGSDGAAASLGAATQSHLAGTRIELRVLDGTLENTAAGTVTAGGHLVLTTGGLDAHVVLGGSVTSNGGQINLQAGGNLLQNADIAVTGAGDTLVVVASGDLTQADGVSMRTNGGDAVVSSAGTLTIETMDVGAADLLLTADVILDGDADGDADADIFAAGLSIETRVGSAGTAANALETAVDTLAALLDGDLFLTDVDALSLEQVTVDLDYIVVPGTIYPVSPFIREDVAGDDIVIRTMDGSLSTQSTGAVQATGNVLLEAGGAGSDLAADGAVQSEDGHVTLVANQDLLLGANVVAQGEDASIALFAGRDLSQDADTVISIGSGTIALDAVGTVTFESITAGTGSVSITAASVLDGDTDPDDAEVDIEAAVLVLQGTGAMGVAGNAIETSVDELAVAGGGNLFLTETDGLDVASLSVQAQRVGADGVAAAAAQASVAGLATGTTVVRTLAGTLTVVAGADVAATGDTLLWAAGEQGDLVLRAEVGAAGDLSLVADGDLLQAADVGSTSGGSVVLAAAGDVTQVQGTAATTPDGILAVEAGGTFTLASLRAGDGAVRINAAAVVDVDANGDTDVDVEAGELQLAVDAAVGTAANAVETTVATLSVDAQGAVFLAETDDLEIGATSITLLRVDAEGNSNADDAAELAGLQGGAAAVVQALAGSLAVTEQVSVAGNLLLRAAGGTSDLTVGANVASSGGRISLDAGRNLLLDADVAATGGALTIDLLAGTDIVQAQDTSVSTSNGAIALDATGDVTIERVFAGTAGVRIAAGNLLDGDADGDTDADITAASALLVATGAVGAGGNALETDVARLSAHAGGAIFIAEASGLTLDTLTVNVERVGATGASTATAHAAQAGVDGGTVVVRTVAGNLASSTTGAVAADGNLLLQAGGAGATLTLAALATATGDLSLDAAGTLTLAATASVTTTGAGSSIDLLAGGAFAAAEGSLVRSADGNVLLQATAGVTIDTIDAGAGAVRITGASIMDGAASPDSGPDILAAQVLLAATGNVGTASNALSTNAGTLTVAAGGTVSIIETDALVLGTVTAAAVDRVGADGTTAVVAAVTQSGVTGTTITVRAVEGGIDITDDITGTGHVTLRALGTIDMGPDVEVRTEGDANIVVTSEAGSVLMDPATGVLRTGSGDIHLTAEIDIRPGALITTGFSYLDARDGRVLIQGDLQRNGEDIDIFANDVTIEEPVSSPGGTLRIGPLEVVPMIIGGPPPSGAALHLDTGELALLQDGFRQIVLGSDLDRQLIEFRGTDATLVFRDPLVVNATGDGGKVLISGKLRGDSFTLLNSGTNTTLRGATITMGRSVLVQDQLIVRGSNAILGAQDSGSLRFTQTVTGYGGSGDKLTLDANGRDMRFDKAVSKLDGLTIRDADDVTFKGTVSVSGDLVIEASGTVTFEGKLTLTNGGRLIVTGGGKVVFGSSANLGSGDHLLKVAAVQAKGGTGSIRGTGELELRGPTNATAIHIGSGAPRGALAIGDTFLRAIGKGFDALQIGNGDAKVTIGATDLRSTASPVVVDGKTIALKGTGSGVRLGTDLTLHASGSITTSGKIVASKAVDVALDSDKGAITMARGASIHSLGGDVSLEAATGLQVADIDARGTRGAPGLVNLESTKGTITDANRDKAIDIYARGVTMKGLGPKVGSGDVLEIGAHVVRITPPAGSVLRESGTDGRAYFNVLQGRNLYQAMVVVGPVTRVTTNVETYLSRMTESELSFSSGQAIKRGSQVNYWSETIDL